MAEPIDFIDLTEESPINQVLRLRNRNYENVSNLPNKTSRRRKRNLRSQEATQYVDSTIIEIPDNSVNYEISGSKSISSAEVIDLDETMSPKQSGACLLNDSVSGTLVVLKCPICFEQLSTKMKPTSTRCGHIFCAQCLELATREKKKCPTCQAAVKLKSCTRLYF